MDKKYVFFKEGFRGLYGAIGGKMCFPDRTFENPAAGVAEIDYIKDKGKYAFICGRMIAAKPEISFAVVQEYLKDQKLPEDIRIGKASFGAVLFLGYGNGHIQRLIQVGDKLLLVSENYSHDVSDAGDSGVKSMKSENDWIVKIVLARVNKPLTEDEIFFTQVKYQRKLETWTLHNGLIYVETKYGISGRIYYKDDKVEVISVPLTVGNIFKSGKALKKSFADVISFRKDHGLAAPKFYEEDEPYIQKYLMVANFKDVGLKFYNSFFFEKSMLDDPAMKEMLDTYATAYKDFLKKYGAGLTAKTVSKMAYMMPGAVLGGD